ncbi:Rv3235 family protein [Nocardia sp. NPDC050406]|uniref:Rv3235 family protein n=1 Tax=Nocardia sp. NPDC050406 TaxID=3364318 RepID=UPI0037A15C3C
MAFRGHYLSPAPNLEPPVSPCCARRVGRNAARRSRGSALQRLAHAAHPEIPAIEHEVCEQARKFAWRTTRVALEVLDGRRPPAQLAAVADTGVVAAVRTLVAAGLVPGRGLGTAVLTRADVVMVETAKAEVCGSYDRGARHFALAARIALGRHGWRMTAFRIR